MAADAASRTTASTISNVLQVNIRLSEGGAAGVARTLADELRRVGIASPFAYGYGTRGGSSPLEVEYDGVRVTPGAIAAVNRLSYSTLGKETALYSPRMWSTFARAIQQSDVVHLHAIHSYFTSADRLIDEVIAAGKPVTWTLHDQWIMTGRCAQPGSCRLWESGCQKCPDLNAYPPARFDHAAARWKERYASVARLQDAVPTAIVACADWLAEEAERAGIRNVSVVKNSVDRGFWDAVGAGPGTAPTDAGPGATVPAARVPAATGPRNLFMCRDLRDPNKVDWDVLARVAALPGQGMTIVGDNPEQLPPLARHIPAITDRAELAAVLGGHDRLIFTSQVDYFPLTIAEALTAGMRVFAIDSQAAREFRTHPGLRLFASSDELVAALALDSRLVPATTDAARDPFFAPERMANEYLGVYESLVGAANATGHRAVG